MSAEISFGPDFDPTLPGHPDPYPIYDRLRSQHPVFWSDRTEGWVLTRYADAVELLHDRRFGWTGYVEGPGSGEDGRDRRPGLSAAGGVIPSQRRRSCPEVNADVEQVGDVKAGDGSS
jgi:hypothetical protein